MAGKQTQYLSFIVILAVILIGLFWYGGVFQETIGGTMPLSIDEVALQSTISYFSGKAWVIEFTTGNTLEQGLYGTLITPEKVSANYEGDQTTGEEFTFAADFEKQQCIYDINLDEDTFPVSTTEIHTWSCGLFEGLPEEEDIEDEADDNSIKKANIIAAGRDGLFGDCFIFHKVTTKQIGEFGSGNYRHQGTFYLDTEDYIDSFTVDTLDGEYSSYFCSDDSNCGKNDDETIGYVTWVGDLVKKQCEDQSTEYVALLDTTGWDTVSRDNYDNYDDVWDDEITALESHMELETADLLELSRKNLDLSSSDLSDKIGHVDDIDFLEDAESNIDSAARKAQREVSIGEVEDKSEVEGALLIIEKQELVAAPIFTLYVKADIVGIETFEQEWGVVSDAELDQCIQTGQEGDIIFSIENKGDVEASLTITGSCDSGWSIATEQVKVAVGDTENVGLDIDTSYTTAEDGECTITITDGEGDKETIKNVDVCSSASSAFCDAGTSFCDIDETTGSLVVATCASDGSEITYSDICVSGQETCTNAACVPIIPTGDTECSQSYWSFFYQDCEICDSKLAQEGELLYTYCLTENIEFSLIYGILIGLAVAAFSFILFSVRFRSARPEIRVATYILAVALGIIAGIFSSIIVEHWIISTIVIIVVLGVIIGIKTVLARFGLA